jgi:putative glutamine amidotransferase
MKPRIALPVPNSADSGYNQRSLPTYTQALLDAGADVVLLDYSLSQQQIADTLNSCVAVMLPGSPADTNPQKYGAERIPACGYPDPAREAMDDLLIQDAHNLYKPILAICYGTQSLNVWRSGTLIQDLPKEPVFHPAGKAVPIAHAADIAPDSILGNIVAPARNSDDPSQPEAVPQPTGLLRLPVNSSHHQAIDVVGDGLRVVARCPVDNVIEAVEGTNPDHFVLAVQWHPERSTDISAASRAIFTRFLAEARAWSPRKVTDSVG